MFRVRIVLLAVSIAAMLGGCATYDPNVFDDRLRTAVFDRYWEALDAEYPYFDLYDVDWDASRLRYRERAISATTPDAFYHGVARMFAELNDPHVAFDVPRAAFEATGAPATTLDLTLTLIERRIHLVTGPGGADPLPPPGAEDVRYPQLIAIDGDTFTPQLLPVLCTGTAGSVVELELDWGDGIRSSVAYVRPLASSGWTSWPPAPEGGEARTERPADASNWLAVRRVGNVGYLAIRTFMPPGAADSLDTCLDELDAAVDSILDCEGLIVDLQGNSGGSIRLAKAFLERVVDRAVTIEELEIVGPLGLYRNRVPWQVRPRERVYTGPMAILIDGGTASAAEECASLLGSEGRATLIGERTSGAESRIMRVEGPDGTTLRFGAKRFRSGLVTVGPRSQRSWQGAGVSPDVEIALTNESAQREGLMTAVCRTRSRRLRAALETLDAPLLDRDHDAAAWVELVIMTRMPLMGTVPN